MQISPSNNSVPVAGVSGRLAPVRGRDGRDQANLAGTESLDRALQQTPDVREAEVARGKALVNDVQYPPVEVIQRIARLLAFKMHGDGE